MAQKSITLFRYNREVDVESILSRIGNDVYFLILNALIEKKASDTVYIVYNGKHDADKRIGNITVVFRKGFKNLPPECLDTDLLWVRGDKREYMSQLRRGTWKKRIFYGASSHFYPYKTWGYDAILVDEPEHYMTIAKRYPEIRPLMFIKPADERIFFKIPDAEKQYDVCIFSTLHKNPKAFDLLVAALPEMQFLVIGRDDVKTVEHLKGRPNIHWAGRVSQTQANLLLNQSKIGVVLSENDGAPRVILESMAAGLPQLLNNRLLIGKTYLADACGKIAGPESFPAAVRSLVENYRSYAPEIFFKEHYSIDRAAGQFAENLELLEKQPASRVRCRWLYVINNTDPVSRIRSHFIKRVTEKLHRVSGD
ncbi:MAG: glycosyltransferase [Gammaproteobacteria bacterium]